MSRADKRTREIYIEPVAKLAKFYRHYGILANRAKHIKLAAARAVLDQPLTHAQPQPPESVAAFWLRIANIDIHRCTHCEYGRMRIVASISAPQPRAQSPPQLS